MSLRSEGTGLFVQAANVFEAGLSACRINEVHAAASRQHKDPANPGIMQKAHHIVRELYQEDTAKPESSFKSVVIVRGLVFHGCG